MISPRLQPDPLRAACQPRRRLGFGLTQRAILLLAAGLLLTLPGFFSPRLAYAMLAWDAVLICATLLDGLRLPKAFRDPDRAQLEQRSCA